MRNAAHLLRLRIRAHPIQQLSAIMGIAVGVALLFGVQVATTSISGSVEQIAHAVTGDATIEVVARSPAGFDQSIFTKAEAIPAVRDASPIVVRSVAVRGPSGNVSLMLVGADERLERFGGGLVRKFGAKREDLTKFGLVLTAGTAEAIGVETGERLKLDAGADRREVVLGGVLNSSDIGDLVESPVAIAPLGTAQRLTNSIGKVDRMLVAAKPGREAEARRDLQALVGGSGDVRSSAEEARLLEEALKPDRQSSLVFSSLAVAIGMLFAFNAILLSMAFRRKFIGSLRMIGTDRPTVVAMLVLEAFAMGIAAALLGILLGEVMSRVVFDSFPRYLSAGFPIGEQRVVSVQTIVVSIFGGVAASFAALVIPAYELYSMTPGGEAREDSGTGWLNRAFTWLLLGVAVLIGASLLAIGFPTLTPLWLVLFVIGFAIVAVPIVLGVLGLAQKVVRVKGGVGLSTSVSELSGAPARALAIALIAAGAMVATLGIGGARHDVERGTKLLNHKIFRGADLWVLRGGVENSFLTTRFEAKDVRARLQSLESVESLDELHGAFADIEGRRVLIAAHPTTAPTQIASDVIDGDALVAQERIRSGGWIALYEVTARELGLGPGDWYSLPTPSGEKKYRIAATVANYGWPSGVVIMNGRDFSRAWDDGQASAIAVDLKPGVSIDEGRRQIDAALGPASALSVKSPAEAESDRVEIVAQGLSRLRQISVLVLLAAALAIVAAMFAAVWHRRPSLASLRALGMYRGELLRSLFAETSLTVLLGALIGAVFGVGAQFFAARWISYTSGFHAPFEPAIEFGLVNLLALVSLSVAATAVPAVVVLRVAPAMESSD